MPTKSNKSNAKLVPFLRKLQVFVNSVVPKDVGAWNESGTRFLVFDQKRLEELVKQHFQWTSAQTFNRQLNLYDFTKEDTPYWSFGHPCFLRDEPSKIFEIKRFARASDKEDADPQEEGSGSRVQFLENKISALQSMVDDLSVKLAKVQLALSQAATTDAREQPHQEQKEGGFVEDDVEQVRASAKRSFDEMDCDETDDEGDFTVAAPSRAFASRLHDEEMETCNEEARAQELLSSLLITREFHTVVSSALQKQPPLSDAGLVQEEIR